MVRLEIGARVVGLIALALVVTSDDDLAARRYGVGDLLEEALVLRIGLARSSSCILRSR